MHNSGASRKPGLMSHVCDACIHVVIVVVVGVVVGVCGCCLCVCLIV